MCLQTTFYIQCKRCSWHIFIPDFTYLVPIIHKLSQSYHKIIKIFMLSIYCNFIFHTRIPLIKAAHFSKIYIMSESQNMLNQCSSCLSYMKLKDVQCLEALSGCNVCTTFGKQICMLKTWNTWTNTQTTQQIYKPPFFLLAGKTDC